VIVERGPSLLRLCVAPFNFSRSGRICTSMRSQWLPTDLQYCQHCTGQYSICVSLGWAHSPTTLSLHPGSLFIRRIASTYTYPSTLLMPVEFLTVFMAEIVQTVFFISENITGVWRQTVGQWVRRENAF